MKVIVSGGGTGGHIYPALALIRYIQSIDQDAEFLYVGTEKGLESQIVKKEGIPFKTVEIQGFKRSLSFENVKTIQLFFKAIKQSKEIIKEFQPDIVIGTGGYVCGAVVYAASRLNIPTMIHEQNSVAGVTNKFLSKFVDKVAICFDDVATAFPENKVVMTGNPRAQEIAALTPNPSVLEQYQLSPDKKTVLIFGGSRGALTINESFLQALEELNQRDYQVLYVSGRYYYDEMKQKLEGKVAPHISVQPYIDNMPEVLTCMDAVVARSGATTLAELTALGIPSILIPSPNVTNDHQTKNAMSLVNANAALMIRDDELNGETLVDAIDNIMQDDNKRIEMAEASKRQGMPDAAKRLYHVMSDLVK